MIQEGNKMESHIDTNEPKTTARIVTIINPYAEIILHQANEMKYRGDYEQALTIYDQVLSIDPRNARAYHAKGNIMDILGNHKEAVSCYNSALECDPLNAETWYNKGVTLSKMGCQDEGIECIRQGVSLATGS